MTKRTLIIMLFAFFACLVMPTSFAQSDDDAQMILLFFSEPMSKEGIFDINNYEVIANGNSHARIFKVRVVGGDTAVVFYIEKNYKWKTYTIEVLKLKDLSGNTINYKKNFAFIDSPKMAKFEEEY